MTKITRFEDLKIWQAARGVCCKVFILTNKTDFSKDFSLKDQIRRSSGSVMDNIAEGFGRSGNKEFKNFLSISKGSLQEVKSQLYRAIDFKYISTDEFENLYLECDTLAAGIGKLMQYIKESKFKGTKF
ncbi:MAG: four helix bundle protein [Bacteroidales bacterium]|nr:four helix bundle protein [Bacteroidales bacterium]